MDWNVANTPFSSSVPVWFCVRGRSFPRCLEDGLSCSETKLEVLSASQSYAAPSSVSPYHCASSLVVTVISVAGVYLSLYTQKCGRYHTFYFLYSDIMSGSKSPPRSLVDSFFLSTVVARPLSQGDSDRLTLCLERKEDAPPLPSLIVSAEAGSLCFRATLKMPGVLARLEP